MNEQRCNRIFAGKTFRETRKRANGLVNIKIIRSLPIGFFNTSKPVMPLVPDKFFLLHPGKRDATIRQLWRKEWRKEVLTPWYEKQLKTPQESRVSNLGSTTKRRESRVVTGWV